jgi:hypothetical protein
MRIIKKRSQILHKKTGNLYMEKKSFAVTCRMLYMSCDSVAYYYYVNGRMQSNSDDEEGELRTRELKSSSAPACAQNIRILIYNVYLIRHVSYLRCSINLINAIEFMKVNFSRLSKVIKFMQ